MTVDRHSRNDTEPTRRAWGFLFLAHVAAQDRASRGVGSARWRHTWSADFGDEAGHGAASRVLASGLRGRLGSWPQGFGRRDSRR
jgi:hypothetical protein